MNILAVLFCGLCLASLCLDRASSQHGTNGDLNIDEKFILGVRSYAEDDWPNAILYISDAMEEHKKLKLARLDCFKKCKGQEVPPTSEFSDDREMEFFYSVIKESWCTKRCEVDAVGPATRSAVTSYVLNQLESKEGYNYLHIAYYNEEKLREAARASVNYIYVQPHNTQNKRNYRFYKSLKVVTEEDMKPTEELKYRELFYEGHASFYAKNWTEMVETIEESLGYFYRALDKCRSLCDGPMKYNMDLDFSQTIGFIHRNKLQCRVNCVHELGEFRNDRLEDFFGVYFHYLQKGYHGMNMSLEALQSSAAHVRLEPYSDIPKRNSVFYLGQPGVTRKDFNPSEDALPEVIKREKDLAILKLFNELSGNDQKSEGKGEEVGENENQWLNEKLLEEDFERFPVGISSPIIWDEITPVVVQRTEDFGGIERLVVDGILTKHQCSNLIDLASFGQEGDGYERKSPHTLSEKFEGLHILDAAKRAISGEFDKSLTWLYLNSSHVSKDIVANEFELSTPLYFSYTHLVCRTALEGLQEDRADISHPVHSDNCVLNQEMGTCKKVSPAYTWRDYSAILYLNDEFEGGDFFFAHSIQNQSPDVRVRPKCGRLVGFSNGEHNLHGVTAVTKGRRCAVALWFTLDPHYKEGSFEMAADILSGRLAM